MPGPVSSSYKPKAPQLFRVFMDGAEAQATIAALDREMERAMKGGDHESYLLCRTARHAIFEGCSFNPQSSSPTEKQS